MGLNAGTAVLTGGSSGIGLAIAEAYQRRGANVVVFGRKAEALRAAEEQPGEQALAVQGDATDRADLERLFATAGERFGP
jgi:NAD(P)-dependent dehydrogenase (short-subunit alcohol dehydrogenase family)